METQETKHRRVRLEDVAPRAAPFTIYLDPCGACNFKCSFCPCNISGFQAAERHKTMNWELFKKILEDLKMFQGQVKVINLYGHGEPLLNPRIADMVYELKANRCCREVRITTNASLLNEEKSRALIGAGTDLIRVSVEALSTEGYRKLCGVDIDFSTILHNIDTFYRLSRGTGSRISAKMFSATLKTKSDENRFYELFGPLTDHHFIENVEAYWPEFEEIKFSAEHIDAVSKCYFPGEQRNICTFPFTDLFIHSNGLVGACCADWKFAAQYGDVRQEHLTDIWNGKNIRKLQCALLSKDLKDFPFCEACSRKTADLIENPELILKKISGERKV